MKRGKPDYNESLGKRSTRVLSSLFVGRFIATIIAGITFIVVARLLGPSDYGIYTLAVGIYSFIGAVGHFGIGTYFNKHISEQIYKKEPQKINEILSSGYSIILPIATLLMLIGILSSGFISSYFKSQGLPQATVILASIVLFFSMIYGSLYPALVSFGHGKSVAYILILVQLAYLFASLVLILSGFGYNGALAGLMISYIVGTLFCFYFLGKAMHPFGGLKFVKPSSKSLKQVMHFSLPIAANNFVNNATLNFGTILLGIYATSVILGSYGAATRGLNMLQTFYDTVGVILLPTFSAMIVINKRIGAAFNKAIKYALIIILPIMVYIVVLSKPLMFFLITNKYSLAPEYLSLMSIGIALGLPALYSSAFIVSKSKVLTVLKYRVISSIIQLAALIYLVPHMRAIGAIISLFVIGSIINNFLFLGGIKKLFGINVELANLARVFLANILLGLVMLPVILIKQNIVDLLFGFILGFLVYPILLALSGVANTEFLNDIKRFTRDIPFVEKVANFIVSYLDYFVRV